ncbi:FAS1-like dehydratase domain-containing protein [Nakamurella lactea]|uniref:FAS1-like dehydratase domain-containing protein n=1 Tax=Nakamurella lactea TaxID=459515 RepID=UPI00040FE5D8
MPMDPSFAGREYPLGEAYLVGVEKVREFAAAIGDDNPLFHDRAVARAAGYPDLLAPPTFAFAVINGAQEAVLFDPALGLDFSRVVHGDQRFVYSRPIVAGDELSCTIVIDSIKNMAGNDMITLRSEIVDATGAHVVTGYGMLVSRAAG